MLPLPVQDKGEQQEIPAGAEGPLHGSPAFGRHFIASHLFATHSLKADLQSSVVSHSTHTFFPDSGRAGSDMHSPAPGYFEEQSDLRMHSTQMFLPPVPAGPGVHIGSFELQDGETPDAHSSHRFFDVLHTG